MDFEYEESTIEHLRIKRIVDGGFVIENHEYHGSVFINESRVIELSHVNSSDDITMKNISPLLEYTEKSDMLLIGCGPSFKMWERDLDSHIRKTGLAFEYMNTKSAVDSLTILQAENRYVSAILVAI